MVNRLFVGRRHGFLRRVAALGVAIALLDGLMLPTPSTADAAQTRLKVVATFSLLGDWVKNVGGDRIALVTLVGANGDAHTYEPTPADTRAIADTEIILENGLGFEHWLDRLYAASRSTAPRIPVTQGVTALRDERGDPDPHFWTDVSATIEAVQTIRDALAGVDPPNAENYSANADAYVARLERLDTWIGEQVASLPADRRKLVTSHDTLAYFARRYGFEIVGFAMLSPEAQPSARQINRLVQDIRATGVPTVFVENVSDTRLLQRVAREAGVTVGPQLYTDALGTVNSPASTYVELITYNVQVIISTLSRD